MSAPAIPINEAARLEELSLFSILDTMPEKEFDDMTTIASEICQTPISLITLIDKNRQWFKSKKGTDLSETSRNLSFCAHAINQPDNELIIEDATKDRRFSDNPYVTNDPHVVFYAGIPLVSNNGFALGTICVIDTKPRHLTEGQLTALKALSRQVVRLLEMRRANHVIHATQQKLETKCEELERFAYVVSHDIKSPLNNVISLLGLLMRLEENNISEKSKLVLNTSLVSIKQLKSLVDGIIGHYMSLNYDATEVKEIDLTKMCAELIGLLNPTDAMAIDLRVECQKLVGNEIALRQIFINLISNSIKYSEKEPISIYIVHEHGIGWHQIDYNDNGVGMDTNNIMKIFEPFSTLGKTDRFGNKGTGIGLATVKQLIDKLGGQIDVRSEIGKGTHFSIRLPH